MSSGKRYRSWCLTYFVTDLECDVRWFKELSNRKGIRYFIVGLELCPTTQKKHFQGYISFNNAKTFKQTKKWFGLDKIHIETANADDFANEKYCSKGEVIIEVGEPLKQGKRSDIERAVEIVKETGSISRVLDQVHSYQAVRHAELYMKYKEPALPRPNLQVINIWGPSGRGKTRYVYENETNVFCPINFKWWDGYDGHEVVLLDDIRPDFCSWNEFLRLLDLHPYRVECKGGSRQLRAQKIYITTPRPFVNMFETSEDIRQLERRITHTYHIDALA